MKIYLSVFAVIVLVFGVHTFSWGDINDGLIAYYPFNGNINDESGNGHHGTIHGTVATWTTGKIQGALDFNGGSYVEVANSAAFFNSLSALTITAWVNTPTFPWAQGIVYKGDMNWEPFFLRLTGNAVHGYIRNSNGTPISIYGGYVSANTWHHAAMTYDGAYIKVYLDGVEVISTPQSGITYSNNKNLFIGAAESLYSSSRAYFNGIIDDVRIYNRAISQEEIWNLNGGSPDEDGDGVPDDQDICPGGDDSVDTDGDLVPDYCDPCPNDAANDADGDGVCGDVDTCAGGDDNQNADGDALPDFCDVCPLDPENDADGDGICEADDNCPLIANDNQNDIDDDNIGDACDDDIDGDTVSNDEDNCPYDINTAQTDTDGDGAGDVCDDDIDGDSVLDAVDACVPTPLGDVVNADGCSIAELCPCAHPDGADRWKNHGAYVRCVAHTAEDFVSAGLITEIEKDAIVSEAGQSSCGHKN